jgi:transcription elongation factor Elf1
MSPEEKEIPEDAAAGDEQESEGSDAADNSGTEIKDTDIIFDCPLCGKSLAIDYKGAGLTIPCTDCGKMVEVPIPDGMELGDIDSSSQDQEAIILNLRKSLQAAEHQIAHLEDELRSTDSRRDSLEKVRTENIYRFGTIVEKAGILQKALDEISIALRRIVEVAREQADAGRPTGAIGRPFPPPLPKPPASQL